MLVVEIIKISVFIILFLFLFRNSLSLEMMNHLIDAINLNKNDTSLRAIVLSAKGNVFSAGHNLKELVSKN